ncbi:MAG: T9SS type A sorting domain-containing protein [Flavobacteriales bacterium]|nr:T9SS type A sorting domain-containing protein [Flavobacteriales bacterium]
MRILLFISFVLIGVSSSPQHPFLSRFTANVIDDGVFLEWTIKAGNTCEGIRIEHAKIAEDFSEIGEIVGVCGSVEKDEDYTFTHIAPSAGEENRYRLLLGIAGYTEEISVVYFDYGQNGYVILHDRLNQHVTVVSSFNSDSPRTVSMYSSDGRLLSESEMRGSSFQESTAGLSNGVYTLVVLEENELVYTTRFVKSG